MRHTILTVLFIAAAALSSAVDAKGKPLKVVICAGQSNMVGKRSTVSALPKDLQGTQKNLFFNGKSWVPMAPGKTEEKGFGPEISFAHEMSKRLKEPVGIIKHSAGGTNLDKQWNPKDSKSLYAALLKKVKAAQESKDIEIVGMIWMQGESDSKESDMANTYDINLANFITATRKDFKSPEMCFVAGRVNPPKKKYPYVEKVRKAQEQCKDSSYAFIDCDTLEKGSDKLHYTTKGVVDMGHKFAEVMLQNKQIESIF